MLQLHYRIVGILGEIVDWRDAQKSRPKRPCILCRKSFHRGALFRVSFARPLEDSRVGTSPSLPSKLAEIATGAGKVNVKEHAVKADVKISQQSHWPVAPSGEALSVRRGCDCLSTVNRLRDSQLHQQLARNKPSIRGRLLPDCISLP